MPVGGLRHRIPVGGPRLAGVIRPRRIIRVRLITFNVPLEALSLLLHGGVEVRPRTLAIRVEIRVVQLAGAGGRLQMLPHALSKRLRIGIRAT